MSENDKRKQSIYFPTEMLAEIQAEAARMDRSLSWTIQFAWRCAKPAVARLPSMNVLTEQAHQALLEAGPKEDA